MAVLTLLLAAFPYFGIFTPSAHCRTGTPELRLEFCLLRGAINSTRLDLFTVKVPLLFCRPRRASRGLSLKTASEAFMIHFFGVTISSSLLGWVIIGLLAGWIAGEISRGSGFGCIANVLIGMVGSILGGWIFSKLGIFGGGFVYSLAAATVGAVVLVLIARIFAGGRHT
jgi:uncharacterized membrane protein YeaQ/YmgE (transglycosylase-associated protein family)